MRRQILDYLGETHASHIHARGNVATQKMADLLDCKPGDQVLELGFGTGATLIELASRHENVQFFGYEASKVMFNKGQQRIRFCRLDKGIHLSLIEKGKALPAPDNSFDKIYVESVLAIQQGEDLRRSLRELNRILKPNGKLVLNETLWLDSTAVQVAQDINDKCLESFGIIQANSAHPHLKDWKKLLEELGFTTETVLRVSDIEEGRASYSFDRHSILSRIFTARGKLKALFNRALKKEWSAYQAQINQIMPPNTPLMEGIIIAVTK